MKPRVRAIETITWQKRRKKKERKKKTRKALLATDFYLQLSGGRYLCWRECARQSDFIGTTLSHNGQRREGEGQDDEESSGLSVTKRVVGILALISERRNELSSGVGRPTLGIHGYIFNVFIADEIIGARVLSGLAAARIACIFNRLYASRDYSLVGTRSTVANLFARKKKPRKTRRR